MPTVPALPEQGPVEQSGRKDTLRDEFHARGGRRALETGHGRTTPRSPAIPLYFYPEFRAVAATASLDEAVVAGPAA